MTASGLGALGAAVALVVGGRPRPIRIAVGAIVLGIASVALAFSTHVPAVARADGPRRRRRHRDGGDGQRDDPAGGPGRAARAGDERLHDGLLRLRADRRHRGRAPSRPALGVPVADRDRRPRCRSPSACVAFVWWRRIRASESPATRRRRPTRPPSRSSCRAPTSAPPQSTAPSTSAAFSPPNPNEVLSTRR